MAYRLNKFISILILLIMLLSVLGCRPKAASIEEVTFPDSNLERIIRKVTLKYEGPILRPDLEKLTFLYGMNSNVTNLTGLEHCINLTKLEFSFNDISDISPLASLTNLTELWLVNNQISDVSPLAPLTRLTELDLSGNEISDISPLASLNRITELHLEENEISDISPLASLINLKVLGLRNNQIRDISSLVSLTGLIELHLDNNPLSAESVNIYLPIFRERGVSLEYIYE